MVFNVSLHGLTDFSVIRPPMKRGPQFLLGTIPVVRFDLVYVDGPRHVDL